MGFNSGFKGLISHPRLSNFKLKTRVKWSEVKWHSDSLRLLEKKPPFIHMISWDKVLCLVSTSPGTGFPVRLWEPTQHIRTKYILLVGSLTPVPVAERSKAARLLKSWIRIPPGAWMFVCCKCCVLSGKGLCDDLITRPEESYRMWCVVVCNLENLKNEEAITRVGSQRHSKKKVHK